MRPVRLEMVGFGAFRDPTEVDFSDVDYLALVGPTGSGKSTVIDAICFALYGSVPRYDDKRRVGYVVTTGATEAKVSFTFDAGGKRYVATRVVRRRPDGSATTREARLELLDDRGDGGSARPLAGSVGELDALIQGQVLGMPFDHFTRCVVLPQGDFARFLLDKPEKRQEFLVSLLGLGVYTRMGQRANRLSANREGQATQLRAQVDARAFATPEAVEQAETRLAELGKLRGHLGEVGASLGELRLRHGEARAQAERAGRLAAAVEAVSVPVGVAEAGAQAVAARHAHEAAEATLQAAGEAATAAAEELAALGERAPVETALLRHRQQAEAALQARDAAGRLSAAATAAEATAARLSQVEAGEADARAALDGAQAAYAAHFVAERLVVGKPCPVCLAEVGALPEHPPVPARDEAKRRFQAARQEVATARPEAAAAAGRAAAAAERLSELRHEEEKLADAIASGPPVAQLRESLTAIDAATEGLARLRQAEGAARQRVQAAARQRAEADQAMARLWQVFDTTRDGLAELAPPLPGRHDVAADWAALARWAEEKAPGWRAAVEQASGEAGRLAAAHDQLLGSLVVACAEASIIDAPPAHDPRGGWGFDSLTQACLQAEANAAAGLESTRRALAQAAALVEQVEWAEEEATVAKDLARHLSAKGFERWMLSESLAALVAGASVILQELSSGGYSLATDAAGEFWVVDHRNADERRSAKTLSGGETFQASLALALALAEQLSSLAAAGAARIEATFIDEGFGALDADTLETVAGTLENLGGDDRLVGIVTHVRELAERVPVRLEVSKGPRTATVTKVVA